MTHPSTRLFIFFALTFAWSWTCWLLAPVIKADASFAPSALFFLGGFGPSLAAFAVVGMTGGRDGLRVWLARCLQWRGYALPAIQDRLGWRSASLVLGSIWGVWHLPLFLIAGSSQNQGSLLAFFALIVAASVFYTWLFNRSTDSLVPVLLLHTASNSWPSLVPILPSDENQRPYLLVVALVVTAAIWLLLRRDGQGLARGFVS